MHAYGAWGTPSAVLVASDGTVRSALASGPVAIESLIRLALQSETPRLSPLVDHKTPSRAAGLAA